MDIKSFQKTGVHISFDNILLLHSTYFNLHSIIYIYIYMYIYIYIYIYSGIVYILKSLS